MDETKKIRSETVKNSNLILSSHPKIMFNKADVDLEKLISAITYTMRKRCIFDGTDEKATFAF